MDCLTKIETDRLKSFEEQYGYTSSISVKGTKTFLDGIKSTIKFEKISYSEKRCLEEIPC